VDAFRAVVSGWSPTRPSLADVTDGFADQLSQTPYAGIEDGILNITD
jgi:hypothetical protein